VPIAASSNWKCEKESLKMRTRSIIRLVVLVSASLAAILPVCAGEIFRSHRSTGSWNTSYYDPAWGMPEAVVVPPRARWQSNYAWGVGGSRVDRVGAQFKSQSPGPESSYRQRDYLPAPPQPSDTQQMGANYVRGPGKHR
jgi:hypothetical protein